MGGAITAVAATTMAGGIITIGGDFHLRPKRGCGRELAACFRSMSSIKCFRTSVTIADKPDIASAAGCSDLGFGAPLGANVVAGIVGLIRFGFALQSDRPVAICQ